MERWQETAVVASCCYSSILLKVDAKMFGRPSTVLLLQGIPQQPLSKFFLMMMMMLRQTLTTKAGGRQERGRLHQKETYSKSCRCHQHHHHH